MAVTGIGGDFFRTGDPGSLAKWHEQHLGLTPPGPLLWMQDEGPTVFARFSRATDYFTAGRTSRVNFRMSDLDALTASHYPAANGPRPAKRQCHPRANVADGWRSCPWQDRRHGDPRNMAGRNDGGGGESRSGKTIPAVRNHWLRGKNG